MYAGMARQRTIVNHALRIRVMSPMRRENSQCINNIKNLLSFLVIILTLLFVCIYKPQPPKQHYLFTFFFFYNGY